MNLGEFSISLAVKDLESSKAFYEKLGFENITPPDMCEGMPEGTGWALMKNGNAKIGLFMGMFEANIITFNPPDIRAIRSELSGKGIGLELKAMEGEPGETGPAHATLTDPDGNLILIDQF